MEKYNGVIKKRMWACIAAVFVIGSIISMDFFDVISPAVSNNDWGDFWRGMILGISVAFEIVFIYFAVRYFTALNDEERLKNMYIKENDERKIKIASQASMNTYWFDMIGLLLGIIIGGYFNMIVSLTCLGVAIYLILIRAILYSYYDKMF